MTQGAVPNYATEWCTLEHYSSACRCLGVTTALITTTSATVIRTITLTITQTTVAASCTSAVHSNTSSLSSTSSTSLNPTSISSTPSSSLNTTSASSTSTASFNTTSTVSITFTSGTWTTTTVITLTDPGTSSGTGTISSGTSVPTIPSSTGSTSGGPPYANRTTSTSLFTGPTLTTTFPNTTTILPPTNTTSSAFPSATICGGENVLLCDGTCVESSVDPQNCGGCGIKCPTGNTCTNGVCTAPTSCAGSECGNWAKCGADPDACICAQDEFGSGVCVYRLTPCEALDRCAQTGDCGFGSVCVFGTCCNNGIGGVCMSTTGCLGGGSIGGTAGKRALLEFGHARGVAVDGGALVQW
ncbi:hypothetical protein BCR34DRAFT_562726 [Clohesyomyces aquaticus]|uniref:Uncharacterized protein n=1 Tax=Clohesyomyces aquaticus TaxID=1231657 RepID=A0A1Y1ZSA1_9PLEO|nr:hypothetical protein BCR34DRAFT_562726 [Clohesyomyces aquaticus]